MVEAATLGRLGRLTRQGGAGREGTAGAGGAATAEAPVANEKQTARRRGQAGLARTLTVLFLSASTAVGGGALAFAQAPVGATPPPGMPAAPPPPTAEPVPDASPVAPPPPWQGQGQAPSAMPPAAGSAEFAGGELAEPSSRHSSRLPAILMWVAGGASLAVGTAFGIAAISAKNDFDDKPTYERADAVHSRAVISDVGFGLGLVLVATGTIFFFSDGEASQASQLAHHPTVATVGGAGGGGSRLRFDPVVGRASGGGVVTLRF